MHVKHLHAVVFAHALVTGLLLFLLHLLVVLMKLMFGHRAAHSARGHSTIVVMLVLLLLFLAHGIWTPIAFMSMAPRGFCKNRGAYSFNGMSCCTFCDGSRSDFGTGRSLDCSLSRDTKNHVCEARSLREGIYEEEGIRFGGIPCRGRLRDSQCSAGCQRSRFATGIAGRARCAGRFANGEQGEGGVDREDSQDL
jgi:hypothetical protein